jgi:hypothetical protein
VRDNYIRSFPQDRYTLKKEPTFGESFRAGFGYQYSPIISTAQEQIIYGNADRIPGYNPVADMAGYEGFEEEFSRAKNPGHLEFIKKSINKNRQYRAVLSETDFFSGALVAGFVDPLNLAFALPVMGQLGLIAKGGMSIKQAAAASAKGGLAVGLTAEAVRAPFDPLNTESETAFNLLTTTAFSTLLGTVPSAARSVSGAYTKSAAKLRDLARGDIGDEIDGIKVVETEKTDVTIKSQKTNITINRTNIEKEFDKKAWTNTSETPKGVLPLPENAFNTAKEYGDFLIHVAALRKTVKREAGESQALYTNRINQEALDRTYSGYGLKETPYTNSIWMKLIPSPGKTILLDPDVPNWVKRTYQLMEGNGAMAMERNVAGKGTQSIRQRIPVYTVRARSLIESVRREWTKQFKGRESTLQISGQNLDDPRTMIGAKGKFNEWFENTIDRFIEASDPRKREKLYASATDAEKKAFEFIRTWYDDFLESSQDVGLLRNVKNIDAFLAKAKLDLEALRMREQELDLAAPKDKDPDMSAKLAKQAEELERDIKYYEGYKKYYAGSRSDYVFPIYYDKQLLSTDTGAREKLTDIFEKHLLGESFLWDANNDVWVAKGPDFNARERAEQMLANILEENPDDLMTTSVSPVGGKHLRHRVLDIPEHEVKDFIIKTEAVFYTYAQKMGRRIEWQRNFGDERIDSILNRLESDMRAKNVAEPKIAKVRAAMLGDYERVMGQHIRDPDRLDNQIARGIKETAGITYLHSAGLSSITDTAMLVFERGFKNTLLPLIDKDARAVFMKAASDIDATVDQTGLMQGLMQDRYIGDSIRGIQPNAVERIFNPITNAFYNIPLVGNNLGMVTRYGKIVDGVLRQSELIRMSRAVANNSAKATDVEYLARYGIDEATAKRIANLEGVWEVDPSGKFYYANKDKWPKETKADRDLILTWDTAMNSGVGNTIMHATSFDKPLIVDGLTYVRWYPWMESLTFGKLKPDPRASTKNIPMARLESGMLSFPFQFMNFTLAATNRITAQVFDPSRQYRLQGAMALFGMSYLSLQLKKPDWWFESKSNTELMMRIADHSAIFGIYSDLFYMGLHGAIGMGAIDKENEYLKGKYSPTPGDALFEPFGAGPGMMRDWVLATNDLLEGNTEEGKSRFYYSTPTLPLLAVLGMKEDFKELYME